MAVDLGDAGVALRVARDIDASGLSPERQALFHPDSARANAQRRQVADAAAAILQARRRCPEMISAMPAVKQLAAELLTMSQPPSQELRGLASEIGIPLR